MSTLTDLGIKDLRPRLSVKPNPPGYMISRRVRRGPVLGATVHWNGPAVGVFGNPNAEINHVVNVDVPNHQDRLGADSLMYHFVIPSDGQIWQSRDLDLIAWHCRHPVGNEQHIAVHLVLGEGQRPTAVQINALYRLLQVLGEIYQFARASVKGHQEWSSTECPGPALMAFIRAYRAGEVKSTVLVPTKVITRWRCINKAGVNVRQGPRTSFPAAGTIGYGEIISADEIKTSGDVETVRGDNRWLHLETGAGFVWAGNFQKV